MLVLRIDTKCSKLLQIKYLAGDGDHQYLNAADADHGTGPETAAESMDHWTITGEMPGTDRNEFALNSEWPATETWIGHASQRHANPFPNSRGMQFLRCRAIHHGTQAGIRHTRYKQGAQEFS